MAGQDTSLALDRARLWERIRQEASLPGESVDAPGEVRALLAAVTGAPSVEDMAACEEDGAALNGAADALDQRLETLQRWGDLLAAILDESLAGQPERLLVAQQALRRASIEVARALTRGYERARRETQPVE